MDGSQRILDQRIKKIKVGLVGCGAIGRVIAQYIRTRFADKAVLYAITEPDISKIRVLKKQLKRRLRVLDIDTLIKKSDLVIEAANPYVAREVVNKTLHFKKDAMILSSGGLINEYKNFFAKAEKNRCRLFVPSGALSGVDALKAASFGKIKRIVLTSRKPVKALLDAPYVVKKHLNLKGIRGEKIIFEGSVREAVKGFPKNINVSATVNLSSLAGKNIVIRIVTSPRYRLNSHELTVEGDFGKVSSRVESKPCKDNPKTSQIAVLSVLATLRDILGYIRVGT